MKLVYARVVRLCEFVSFALRDDGSVGVSDRFVLTLWLGSIPGLEVTLAVTSLGGATCGSHLLWPIT